MNTGKILLGCFGASVTMTAASYGETPPAMRDLVGDRFLIGAALGHHIVVETTPEREALRALVEYHYNTATAENALKWYTLQPQPGDFRFEQADAFIEYCEANNLVPVGHTLLWSLRDPKWVFEDATREILLERMRTHIHTVVGRYKGRVKVWDVVNEAFGHNGKRHEQSPWERIIGPDFIDYAFRFAHEADPDAKLYYNENNMYRPVKMRGVVKMVKGLLEDGVPIHGVGLQGHYGLDVNLEDVELGIVELANLGVRISITEMDITALPNAWRYVGQDINDIIDYRDELNPYTQGLPADIEEKQAQLYADLFRIFVKHHDKIDRVTFWGVSDSFTWLNNRPVAGRTDYPLLFDRNAQPKPAFRAVEKALTEKDTKQ